MDDERTNVLTVTSTITLEEIMAAMTDYWSGPTKDEVFDFILTLDRSVADLQFTERLYAALGDVLRTELEENN